MSNRFKNSLKFIRHVYPQVWLIFIFIVFFVIASALKPVTKQQSTPTPAPVLLATTPSSSPNPNEILSNREQTNGIVAGGIILVLIIVGGTLSVIRQKKQTP
jgi:hypothetical protein